MRRGRIFIYLALIIIIAVVGGWLYLRSRSNATTQQQSGTQATSAVRYVQVISAAQNISPGTLITEAMLSSYQMPEANLVQGLFTDPKDVVNMYAKIAIPQGAPITASEVSAISGNVNLPGSSWSTYIPQGLTAVSIPISRLSTTAFGVRDGDYVDVIVSMLLLDVDPALQSALPNKVASLTLGQNNMITISASDVPITEGRFVLDTVSNGLVYVQPSEVTTASHGNPDDHAEHPGFTRRDFPITGRSHFRPAFATSCSSCNSSAVRRRNRCSDHSPTGYYHGNGHTPGRGDFDLFNLQRRADQPDFTKSERPRGWYSTGCCDARISLDSI